jgi:putative acetyltransferase
MDFKIIQYCDNFRSQIIEIWKKSVIATHDFLKPDDFLELQELMLSLDFKDLEMYLLLKNDIAVGFIGVNNRHIEMLFLSPEYIGQGLGQKLINFAIQYLNANSVDVNEQNLKALQFYKKLGFAVFERTDKDDQGREYPLLKMKLESVGA